MYEARYWGIVSAYTIPHVQAGFIHVICLGISNIQGSCCPVWALHTSLKDVLQNDDLRKTLSSHTLYLSSPSSYLFLPLLPLLPPLSPSIIHWPGLLVAAIINTCRRACKPSISVRSWFTTLELALACGQTGLNCLRLRTDRVKLWHHLVKAQRFIP